MIVDILTLIPRVFDNVFDESILGNARKAGLINIRIHDLRNYGEGRHKTVDDTPFGGGPGMVLKVAPVIAAINDLRKLTPPAPVIALSPQGVSFNQEIAKNLSSLERIVLVCGRYEGFDDRLNMEFDLQISLGDYVISGGEFAAMVVVDAVSRLIPGTVGKIESVEQDSFYEGFLDHPQFTRPANILNKVVPECLLQGNHKSITEWRRGQALLRTAIRRPDLIKKIPFSESDKFFLQNALNDIFPVM